ncbi:tripartite tricarboxylate transporter substrate-binding protein [Bordetella sp. N]|uniref:tripartite tricarboxylate transporter substrate-binding protein n=1 Tax=Bordetella sp. N TaxID=1746199 RepID=UPI0007099FF9|nr:tripartite tricarboxylate transporter substrate-binding protein [Bordetella sp. N]ALM82334.1 hypothetical protein ASB57_04575 [Bordetella sp. N]
MVNVYPDRPITLVVGLPSGDTSDAIAHELALHISQQLGQRIIVENRSAVAGNIGADSVAKSTPDGYTLYLAVRPVPPHEAMREHIEYDLSRAFVPVGMVLKSNTQAHGWCAVLAPKGVPAYVLNRLNHGINSALSTDDARNKLVRLGFDVPPAANTPEMLGDFLEEDTRKWTGILATHQILGLQ